MSFDDALHVALREATFVEAVALVDWGMHSGRIDKFDLHRIEHLLRGKTNWSRSLSNCSDSACESFPESVARTRLRESGFAVRSQHVLPTHKRIDLVVDGRLAIEVDGDAFHRDRFAADRLKDAEIELAGFHCLRFTAAMVLFDWPLVLSVVNATLSRLR